MTESAGNIDDNAALSPPPEEKHFQADETRDEPIRG